MRKKSGLSDGVCHLNLISLEFFRRISSIESFILDSYVSSLIQHNFIGAGKIKFQDETVAFYGSFVYSNAVYCV